jgi:copper chaperone CopZ
MFGRTETQTLTVEGMTCGHCEKRVEQAVGQLAGVRKVKASHTGRSVEISYKKSEPPDAGLLERTIAGLGFKVVR